VSSNPFRLSDVDIAGYADKNRTTEDPSEHPFTGVSP
jgi:hypothetical protein